MARMYLAALAAALITAAMTTGASAQTYSGGGGRESVHIRFEEHLRVFERHGSTGRHQAYRPTRAVPRGIIQVVFGYNANHRRRQEIRHASFCSRGGRLGRLPHGEVACITGVELGDRTIRTQATCPAGGSLGAVPDVDHPVCITDHREAGRLVTVPSCPRGGRLGRVSGVDHPVCITDD